MNGEAGWKCWSERDCQSGLVRGIGDDRSFSSRTPPFLGLLEMEEGRAERRESEGTTGIGQGERQLAIPWLPLTVAQRLFLRVADEDPPSPQYIDVSFFFGASWLDIS